MRLRQRAQGGSLLRPRHEADAVEAGRPIRTSNARGRRGPREACGRRSSCVVDLLERSPLTSARWLSSPTSARRRTSMERVRGAAQAHRAARSQQPRGDPGARASVVPTRALGDAEAHARNAVRIAPLDAAVAQSDGHDHDRGPSRPGRRIPLPPRHGSSCPHASPSCSPISPGTSKPGAHGGVARASTSESVELDPNIFQTLYGWAQMEETDRNFARAGELLDAAEKLAPGAPSVILQRAVLSWARQATTTRRSPRSTRSNRRAGPRPRARSNGAQKGQLLDQMGRHAEAFAAFSEGKRICARSPARPIWQDEAAAPRRAAEVVLHRAPRSQSCRAPACEAMLRSRSSSSAFRARARR